MLYDRLLKAYPSWFGIREYCPESSERPWLFLPLCGGNHAVVLGFDN